MEYSQWLTASQAARSLEISVEYIRVLMRQGRLNYVQTPLGKLIDPDSLEVARASRVGQMRHRA